MRKSVLCGVLLLGSWWTAHASAAAAPLVGRQAPDFVLKGLDGKNLRLSEYRGQVVLVNFWARWASDSRLEMPVLDRINATYAASGLAVIGVSVDEDLRRAHDYAASMKVGYSMLFDDGESIGRDYLLQNMPVTVLVDRSGVVRYFDVGFKRSDESLYLERIRELLRE